MKHDSPAAAYKQAAIENAPPLKIVQMLYEGALRFIQQAEGLDPEDDLESFTRCINKADAIVSELRISLDHEQSPELSESLDGLYDFALTQLRTAFLDRSIEPLAGARNVLATLLEGWNAVEVDAAPQAPESA